MSRIRLDTVILTLVLSACGWMKWRDAAVGPRLMIRPVAGALDGEPPPALSQPVWPPTVAEEVAFFASLAGRTQLSNAEAAHRDRILNDTDLLEKLKVYVLRSPTTAAQAKRQNTAIEILLEAMRTGDADTATEVLRTAVMDGPSDDGETVPTARNISSVRKAAQFHLTPSQRAEMASLLPELIGVRSWQHVVDSDSAEDP